MLAVAHYHNVTRGHQRAADFPHTRYQYTPVLISDENGVFYIALRATAK